MQVFTTIPQLTQPICLGIGNFDGLHLGHKQLVMQVMETANQKGQFSGVLSFEPRPEIYFGKSSLEQNLFTSKQKLRALEELGVDIYIAQCFDREFSQLSHESFFKTQLQGKLKVDTLIVGENFCFGRDRSGTGSWLKQQSGCQTQLVPIMLGKDHKPINSSKIRLLLQSGDVAQARQFLGRPYLVEGFTVRGKQLGRKLNAPTLNISTPVQLLPKHGVYAGYIVVEDEGNIEHRAKVLRLDSRAFPCAVFTGYPISAPPPHDWRFEVHILDRDLEWDAYYDRWVSVYFVEWIRENQFFPSLELLADQISQDKEAVRKKLSAYHQSLAKS